MHNTITRKIMLHQDEKMPREIVPMTMEIHVSFIYEWSVEQKYLN